MGRDFLFAMVSKSTMEPNRPPLWWLLGALSMGVKEQDYEGGHLYLSMIAWNFIDLSPLPPYLTPSHRVGAAVLNTFTAKVDRGRFKYLLFNLPESTLVDIKFTLLFGLK
jgi:hypothetical protein